MQADFLRDSVERARLCDGLQSLHLGDIGPRFLVQPEFLKDVREEEILPRLVGLSREGAALHGAGVFEPVFTNTQPRNGVQGFRVMYIEPTGKTQSPDRVLGFSLFGKEAAPRDGRHLFHRSANF